MSSWESKLRNKKDKQITSNSGDEFRLIEKFIEKEAYPACKEIQEKYPNNKLGIIIKKGVQRLIVFYGSEEHFEWRFEIFFVKGKNKISVCYIFEKRDIPFIPTRFPSRHLANVSKKEILDTFSNQF